MRTDVFPDTIQTWIDQQHERGQEGRAAINRHVMSVYAWPLTIYFQGCSDRWLGEPDEVIQGFFADRLARPAFFSEWKLSGLRLRRWIINAFCFYLLELRRKKKNAGRVGALEDKDEPVTFSGDPMEQTDRAFIVSLVRQAMDDAAELCRVEKLDAHWEIFIRHNLHGQAYGVLAEEFGTDSARAAVMNRTATRKFQSAVRRLLERDGVPVQGLDEEIQHLLKATGP
jgi:hypothetical protein